MDSVIYPVFAFFWLTCGLTVGNYEPSSQSENKWNPSNEFFHYDPTEKKEPVSRIDVAKFEINKNPSSIDIYDTSSRKYINNQENLRYRAYLSKFINIFLRSAGFSDDVFEDVDGKTITVDLTLSKKDFAILKQFTTGQDISLETLENCFSSIFNTNHKFPIKTSDFIYYLKYAILIALLLAIVTYTVHMIGKINLKISATSFVLFIAYISVVLHGLLKQYEDKSEQLVLKRIEFENIGKPPKECMFSHMTLYEKMYVHIFKDNTCERFLQSRKSLLYEMDFVSAFTKPFHLIFLAICSMLGEGSEKIVKPLIERSPWPLNILLETITTLMQLPLIFIGIFVLFCLFTSRNISLKIPFFLSMATERNHVIKDESSSKNLKLASRSLSEGSITNYVINKGGIVLLGDENKKKLESYNAQGSSCLGFEGQSQTLQMLQPSSFMNRKADYLEKLKSGGILSKQFATNIKEKKKRSVKEYTYFKKRSFKPAKKDSMLKVAKENLDIVPVSP